MSRIVDVQPSKKISLAVCRTLKQWFANDSHSIIFVMVHSCFEWGLHHKAHKFVCGLPSISTSCYMAITESRNTLGNCGTSWTRIRKHLPSEPPGLRLRALDEQQGVISPLAPLNRDLKLVMELPAGRPMHIANPFVWELITLDAGK